MSKTKKAIRVMCLVLIVACLCYLVYYFYNSSRNKNDAKETEASYVSISSSVSEAESSLSSEVPATDVYSVDFDALKAVNIDVCGWIYIPAIKEISFPIVWCGDDNYYLRRSWKKEYSNNGSIFVEAKNSPDFSDLHTIIYGHDMLDGSMFGLLSKYQEKKFFEENGGIIYICTPESVDKYEIFSVETVGSKDNSVYTIGFGHDETFGTFLSDMKGRSEYDTGVDAGKDDSIITLSTCTDDGSMRFVVHAVKSLD